MPPLQESHSGGERVLIKSPLVKHLLFTQRKNLKVMVYVFKEQKNKLFDALILREEKNHFFLRSWL